MKNFFKLLWQRRWIRGWTRIAITLFAVLVVVRQCVGWYGARRWAAVQEMLAREGETLDFRKITPDPVPDDSNFYAIPLLKGLPLISYKEDKASALFRQRQRLEYAALPTSREAGVRPSLSRGAMLGEAVDLQAWADWLRKEHSLPAPRDSGNPARDVVAALSAHDALVSELASGLNRPNSQWTPAWKTRLLPEDLFEIQFAHYSATIGLTSMLGLRSAAAARAGDAAKAHESVLIAERLNEANMQECFIIGTLIACTNAAVITCAVWELCDAHSGTDEEFRTLQETLARSDYQKAALLSTRGELAASANLEAYLKRTRDSVFFELGGFGRRKRNWTAAFVLRILPGGAFDANAAKLIEWEFVYSVKPLRDSGLAEWLAGQKAMERQVAEHRQHPYLYFNEAFAFMILPVNSTLSARVVYTQCLVNEAIAACMLERYYAEHLAYPDTLEAANRAGEKPIPLDPITGASMGYRKTPNGKYALWCVGLDGKDDGGKRTLAEKHPDNTKFGEMTYVGDWVWDFPGG